MLPVEEDVITIIEFAGHADGWIAAGVTCEQIVVEGGIASAPGAAERVVPRVERFAGNAPLHRHVDGREFGVLFHVAIERQVFVHAPTGGTMIDDDLSLGIAADIVGTLAALRLTAAHAEMAENDIVRVDIERIVRETNAVAGRGLAGDGDVGIVDIKSAFELDNAGDAKDDDARTAFFDGGA